MRHKVGIVSGLASLVLVLSAVFAPLASAFSGYGSGTSASPYRIASCSQLQEINSVPSAYYELVSNINCQGVTFPTISATFTGTLDGQDHTIANFNPTGGGLITNSSGATVENLTISSGSATQSSFVEFATGSTLKNLHSSMTLGTASADYIGGIVGELESGSTVEDSSYNGIITGFDYLGGIAGLTLSGGNLIEDSFSSGTINPTTFMSSNPGYVGGVVGILDDGSSTLLRDYSSMTINMNDSPVYVGGIDGADNTGDTESNSFSAATLSSGTYTGGAFGVAVGTETNDFFDQYLAGGLSCSDAGNSCTAENVSNASPNYFKNNSTNGPMSTWNFSSIWATTSGYPTLQNISGFNGLSGIPNSGDANGDGIADSYQANVADIEDTGSVWSTVAVPSSTLCTIGNSASSPTSSLGADTGYSTESNLDGFDIYCPTAGMTVPVTIIYDKVYSSPTLRYYNPTSQTWSTVPGAVFTTVNIGGVTKTEVTYSITDGGVLDEDGVANGVIVDPVGLATAVVATPAAPNTGFGVSLNRPLVTLSEYSLIAAGLAIGSVVMRRQMIRKSK